MKISAIDMLQSNKNLKFKGDEAESVSTATALADAPESGDTISALNAQSINNIAFQGSAATLKKMGLNAIAALALFTGAASLTSCEKDGLEYVPGQTIIYDHSQVNTNITVNINMTDDELVKAVLEEIKALREEQKQQTEINKAILAELINQGISLDRILTLLEKMNMTAQDIFNLLKENNDKQDQILDEITKGNADLKAQLTAILNSVNSGNKLSADNNKLLTMILVQMGQANKNDKAIISILNQILSKVNESIDTNKEIAKKQQMFLQAILGKLSEIDNHLKQGVLAILGKIDSVSEKNLELLAKIFNSIEAGNQNNEKTNELLTAIFNKVQESIDQNHEMTEKTHELLWMLMDKIQGLDDNMKSGFLAIIKHIDNASQANIDILKQLIIKIDNIGSGDTESSKVLLEILEQIKISIEASKDMDAKTYALLQSILDNIQNFNGDLKTAVDKILAKMDEMKAENKILLGDILNSVQNMNADLKSGFAAVIENQDKMSAENRAFYKEVLAKLDNMDDNAKTGLAMLIKQMAENNTLNEMQLNMLKQIMDKLDKAHQDDLKFYNQSIALMSELLSKIDKLGDKADLILDAIKNITIDGSFDLSTIEKMLSEILEQSKKNGDVLTSIESKLNLVAITLEGIKTQIEIQGGDNKAILKKLDEILNKIPEGCKCDKDLNIIIEILKKIAIEVGKGNNHEGILDDLEDLFN